MSLMEDRNGGAETVSFFSKRKENQAFINLG